MTKKQPISVRLDTGTLTMIDKLAAEKDSNRTAVITEGLTLLQRMLATDRYPDEERKALTDQLRMGDTQHIYLRLDVALVNYYRLNCYRLSTCIKKAVRELNHPWIDTALGHD